MPQQEQGQGAAGTPQECLGWVKRPQGQPQATQEWAQAATELQEMRAVAQRLRLRYMGRLSHHYGWLNRHSRGWVAWRSHLRLLLPGTCPQTFKLATC